jgi:hypothetical protein
VQVAASLIGLAVLLVGCLGYGLAMLRVAGAADQFAGPLDRLAFGFVLGIGAVGWLLFYPGVAGWFSPSLFWSVSGVGVLLVVLCRAQLKAPRPSIDRSPVGIALLLLLLAVLGLDLLEGISPPADADSLAYHFSLPRQFLEAGEIEFVRRALSGAVPLLVHLTYAAALSMGGDLALTLWAMVTGWSVALLLYVVVRKALGHSWALALAIVFLTTPAVLYGAGNGQVETRCAGFALASAAFLAMASVRSSPGRSSWASSAGLLVLAGLCAGFFMGTKYFGLIFVGSVGLAALFHPQWFRRGLIFGVAALVAGFQWYLWNYLHTGDPIFPTLTNLFGWPDTEFWTQDFARYFTETYASAEVPLDVSFLNWLLYPVIASFGLSPHLESGRTGLGIFAFLILPLAAAAVCRREFRQPAFILPVAVAFLFFTVWFFGGITQRVRHLLPVYPLLLAGFYMLAVCYARGTALRVPLVAALAATLALQFAGQGVFSYNYARHVFSGETRSEFLARNVSGANAVEWVNDNLPADAYVAFMDRPHGYLLRRAAFMLNPHIQILVDARPTASDERRFVRQFRRQGLTHLLTYEVGAGSQDAGAEPFKQMLSRLVASGCLEKLKAFEVRRTNSRTLAQFGRSTSMGRDAVYGLVPNRCPE